MERKDYYKILGVSKDATEEEIKKKYKKLALKFHPDKNIGKSEKEQKEAEEKFKEINEAYDTLSSPDKRAKYDNPMSGFDGAGFDFGGFDPFSAFGGFGDFMGGFGRQNKQGPAKGQSIRINLRLTLEDVLNGVTKTIKYKRKEPCSHCGGSGKTSKTKEETCTSCGGTGMIYTQNGPFTTMRTCDKCGGSGKKITNPCSHCGGSGLEDKFNQLDINIPKGTFEGAQYIINEQGNAPLHNEGVYGDLVIVISEEPHETFIRDGANLIVEIEIPVIDAILGCVTEVPTLDGKILSTKIKNGIDDGERVRFKEKGLPTPNGQIGDMIGIIKLKIPKTITDEEKEILNNLKEHSNFK